MSADQASSAPLADRYYGMIDHIVTITLKGQLRSKEQIYQQLVQELEPNTADIFERCLTDRLANAQHQAEQAPDEAKQARASRSLRAIKTIQSEWERYQKEQQVTGTLATAMAAILNATAAERLLAWLDYFDSNQANRLDLGLLKQLAQGLDRAVSHSDSHSDSHSSDIAQLSTGMYAGIEACQQLEPVLVRWLYEVPNGIGFESDRAGNPWKLWSEQVNQAVPKQLFQTIAVNHSIAEWVEHQPLTIKDWVTLAVLLQTGQQGLVTWFEKQPYSSKWGKAQSIGTYLLFAAIWSELMNGFNRSSLLNPTTRQQFSQASFQVLLQILRSFSQKPYFPLYGGVFALFSGDQLKNALSYLDEPLKQVEGTQEKARILTLLGYSQRTLGRYDRAIAFHEQALEIARQAGDRACEIASLNHLSRTDVAQRNFEAAISNSQRALILARQGGDRLGEANALTNLGYSEVLLARSLDRVETEAYEMAVNYLEQGLQLASKLEDRQSQALCYNSLGIAAVVLGQPQQAIPYLEKGIQTAQAAGDLYLQGLNFSYLAEAYYGVNEREKTLFAAWLGMYLLEQIQAIEWRQPAGLLTILQGQLGADLFEQVRRQLRSNLVAVIGVDGYDHLPVLLENYRRLMTEDAE
ncbi:MAG: tetratricopeptide repeat protein [Elainella sp. Prado103]|nr:tetratricopeptide repeat protein [Elainella sp. Prado103]